MALMNWNEQSIHGMHSHTIEHLADALETHIQKGLTSNQVRERLLQFGPNELKERPRAGFLRLLAGQFNNFLILLLLAAAVISFALGESVDAAAILAIVVLNAVLGVVQESRAERALAALRKMAAPSAAVIRDGAQATIPARELVPGDIVLLEAGNYVPADLRLIESVNLRIDESALTGESHAVQKDAQVVLDKDIPVGDRANSAFMSSMITYGRGKGLVTATGMHTQIGLIAQMLQSYEDEPTPLQRRLDELGRVLGVAALAICALIFVFGIIRDTQPAMIISRGIRAYLETNQLRIVDLFMTAVSLAIAAVPEGLPAVVTICLALGMQRMVSRHALIRNHYVGRTFIEPSQAIRDFGVKLKLNPVRYLLQGKRVILVDDSLVRGATSRKIVRMMRQAGAREVHLRISCPPTISPCFYGVDTPTKSELIASSHSVEEIRRFVEADSVGYLSLASLRKAVDDDQRHEYCYACYTGDYPTELVNIEELMASRRGKR